jgi:hypothetical protein
VKRKWLFSILAVFLVFSLNGSVLAAKETGKTKEMLYLTGYEYVFAVDPETEEVTEIPVTGMTRDIVFTKDGHRLFVNTDIRQKVAIIDTAKNIVIDELDFTKDNYRSRIYGMTVDPEGKLLYAMTMRSRVEGTELKTLPPAILVMDIEKKEIVKEIEVPYGVHVLQFYEDGSKIAVWGRDLYEYDIKQDTLTLHYELFDPDDKSAGRSNYLLLWPRDQETDNLAATVNYVYYPETGETTEGFVTWDLKTGDVERIEYKEEPIGFFSGIISRDRKTAYGGMNMLAKTNLSTLKHDKVIKTKLGTSYGFNISGDGKTIYAGGGGPDVNFYDAETLEYRGTVDLKTDAMDVRVVQIKQ